MTVENELLVTVIELEIALSILTGAALLRNVDSFSLRAKIREEAEIGFNQLSYDQKQQFIKVIFSRKA